MLQKRSSQQFGYKSETAKENHESSSRLNKVNFFTTFFAISNTYYTVCNTICFMPWIMEGSRMEGTLDFDSVDLGGSF